MSMVTYPTTPKFSYDYEIETVSKTIHSEFDSEETQSNRQWRFPKHVIPPLKYKLISQTYRDSLYQFWRQRYGEYDRFWFFDQQDRKWYDEKLGRGGPLEVDGAIAYDGGTYTDETEDANDTGASDVTLLPASSLGVEVNDAYYFGSNNRFDRLVITITTAGSHGSDGAWEYYSSTGGWATLSVTTDQTNMFTTTSGSFNVDFTPSTNWQDYTVDERNCYWIRFRITTTSSYNTQPKASQVATWSKTFDIPGILATSSDLVIYENGTSTSVASISSGSGGGGADCVTLSSYPSSGSLITGDFNGQLRLKARFDNSDKFSESLSARSLYNITIGIREA